MAAMSARPWQRISSAALLGRTHLGHCFWWHRLSRIGLNGHDESAAGSMRSQFHTFIFKNYGRAASGASESNSPRTMGTSATGSMARSAACARLATTRLPSVSSNQTERRRRGRPNRQRCDGFPAQRRFSEDGLRKNTRIRQLLQFLAIRLPGIADRSAGIKPVGNAAPEAIASLGRSAHTNTRDRLHDDGDVPVMAGMK